MNSLINKLRNIRFCKKNIKKIMLSVVIILEVIAIGGIVAYAWVETVSSIKITNETNTSGTVSNTFVFTDAMIGSQNGTIDLTKYFKKSGDMHLAPASSADGKTFYFPKANMASGFNVYRKGNVSDKNTTYISVTFRVKVDTNADFFFTKTPAISVSDDIRVSITAQSEGSTAVPDTTIYSNQGGGDLKVIDNTSGTVPSSNNTRVERFTDHEKGKASTARLFAVGGNETKIVTINVWLQKKTNDNTDLTNNMSVSQAINNLGITSSLTPRHVTLLPTPTWDTDGATFYAWCWDAKNDDRSRLYKLALDENEHYSFDYNGTYRKTTFVRAVPGCTVQAGFYDSWPFSNSGNNSNSNKYWNQTVDTTIPTDPVDPTYIIETLNGGTDSKSTGSWHDPAIIHVAHITDQTDTWGTLAATSYVGTTTSTHVIEATNSNSSKHKDTVHAWPEKKLTLQASANSNYAFVGWYDNVDGTGTALSTNATYEPNAPATASEKIYYAKFKEVRKLTIYRYLDDNNVSTACGTITIGGTNSSSGTSTSKTVDKGTSVTFSAGAVAGYSLDGIFTTASDGTKVYKAGDPESSIELNDNTTYYARYTTISYNVTAYSSTGGKVSVNNQTANATSSTASIKHNAPVSISATPNGGYEFDGWYTAATGGTLVSNDSTISHTVNAADYNVYARFEVVNIYMTGYLNGRDVNTTSNDRKFTYNSTTGKYTLDYKFTGNSEQFVTIYDGYKAYHPGSANAGSGTAGTTYNSYISGDDSNNPAPYYKWKVEACKGTTVSFTWDHNTKILSWSIKSRELYLDVNNWGYSDARYAVWVNNDNAFYSMTKVSNTLYKITITNTSSKIIFCRMNGGNTTNSWDNVWNQTADLSLLSDKDKFTINGYSYGTWSLS